MINRLKRFLGQAKEEWHHINWPTRSEGIRLTIIVIGISVGLAVFLGLADLVFSYAIKAFVLK